MVLGMGVGWGVARWWLPLTNQTSMGSLSLVMTALQTEHTSHGQLEMGNVTLQQPARGSLTMMMTAHPYASHQHVVCT